VVAHLVTSILAGVGVAFASVAAVQDCSEVTGAYSGVTCLAASYRLYGEEFCGCDAVKILPHQSTVCGGFGRYGEMARALTVRWPDVKLLNIYTPAHDCQPTEYDMDTIAQWWSLQYLSLSGFRSPIPRTWGDLAYLRSLQLRQAAFHELPAAVVREWRMLESLLVTLSPKLTVVPEELWQLPMLSHVRMFGAAACRAVPPDWVQQACGDDEPTCPGFPQWLFQELSWRRTPRRTMCGTPSCEESFVDLAMFDGNKDSRWSHGDFIAWLTTKMRDAGADDVVEVSEEGMECFLLQSTGNRSSTHLAAGDVASAFWYTSCEECGNYPQSRATIDPRTKLECANASMEFPVVAVADALCSPSSDCIGVCSLMSSFSKTVDRDGNMLINDTELLELGAMTGVSSVFLGMGACLGAWTACPLKTTPMSFEVLAVVGSVFFDYDATDCSSCPG